jgi:hypothetical protein
VANVQDEEAALLAELERIKKERAEEARKKVCDSPQLMAELLLTLCAAHMPHAAQASCACVCAL